MVEICLFQMFVQKNLSNFLPIEHQTKQHRLMKGLYNSKEKLIKSSNSTQKSIFDFHWEKEKGPSHRQFEV